MRQAMEWLEEQDSVDDVICFLDFDGTLAPIVDRPGEARALEGVTELVEALAEVIPVAVISGRGLDDVSERLGARGITYAGSHGLELQSADGERELLVDDSVLKVIDEVEMALKRRFGATEGVELERKKASIAVHYRRAPEGSDEVIQVVQKLAREFSNGPWELGVHEGKMVREIQPQVDRDKGTALTAIWEAIDADRERRPIYIGDDRTDEDAFEVVGDRGVAILVAWEERPSHAPWRLDDPEAVRRWLGELARRLGIAPQAWSGHDGESE